MIKGNVRDERHKLNDRRFTGKLVQTLNVST